MKTRTRWLAVVAALIAVGLVSPVARAATAPRLSLSPTQGPPSTQVTVVGFGFCPAPCSPVDVYFGGAPVRSGVPVGGGGGFRATFMVPATALGGVNTVYATQRDATGTDSAASTTFRITPSTPVGGKVSRTPHGTPTTSQTTQPSAPRSSVSSHPTRTATATTPPPSTSTPPLPSGSSTPTAASHNSGGFSPWWWLLIGLGALGIGGSLLAWRRRAP